MYLVHDIGTTSLKTTLFDERGNEVLRLEEPYKTHYSQNGWAEQEPLDWWNAVVATTRKAFRKGAPTTLAFSSQRESFVLADKNGNPLGRAIIWMDRRATAQAQEMVERFGSDYLRLTTGMIPDTTFTAPKLLWLRQNAPELLESAKHVLQAKDFIVMRLTGKPVTDPSLACRTMLFDPGRMDWNDELVEFVGLNRSQLPDVRKSYEVIGEATSPELPGRMTVVLGGGDRQCEALGSSASNVRAMESTGTTTNLSCVSESPVNDIRVTSSCHVVGESRLIEQGMTTSGAILSWLRDLTGVDYDEMNRLAAEAKPGAIVMLPFFMGAKSTRWNPSARGVILGLSLHHNVGDLARGAMEGVALEVLACVRLLSGLGIHLREVASMGGGSKSVVWNQIKSDVLGMKVEVPKNLDGASIGALSLAMVANGQVSLGDLPGLVSRLNPTESTYMPRDEMTRLYSKMFATYNELYSRVAPLFGDLGSPD